MKNTIIAIVIAVLLIIFAFSLGDKKSETLSTNGISNNVTSVTNNTNTENTNTETEPVTKDNKAEVKDTTDKSEVNNSSQVIEITAKGGYTPRVSVAKAGIHTILRINTNGTFDCSSSVRIPSMNIFKSLPPSGVTDIDLGTPQKGTLNGSCGMGMYPFEIEFQ